MRNLNGSSDIVNDMLFLIADIVLSLLNIICALSNSLNGGDDLLVFGVNILLLEWITICCCLVLTDLQLEHPLV
jgi:hypothetical protein